MDNQDSGHDAVVIIRKYANRRLYNTHTAQFVTLDDLHEMVKRGDSFVVEDAKTGRDITCSVLVQIVSDEETKGHNMLPLNYLRRVLQAYDAGFGPQFRDHLERSIEVFAASQEQFVRQMQSMFTGANPEGSVEHFTEIGRRNMEIFQRTMGIFAPRTSSRERSADERSPRSDEGTPRSRAEEIETLRQQLAAIEERLNTLSQPE